MNTKQFLVLGLSFALVANVAAMDKKADRQRQQEEQKEAARRRIAEQRAERAAANKAPATTPAAKVPAPQIPAPIKQPLAKAVVVPVNIKNDNNTVTVKQPAVKAVAAPVNKNNVAVVKEPAKTVAPPAAVPAKPVAPVVDPKGKEELDNEEPSVWLRDKAQYLAEYKATIAEYCDSVMNPTDNEIATGIRQSLIDANRSKQAINSARESAQTKLQTIEDAYAKDKDFAQLQIQFQALVTIYNTQEQLLDDVNNEELWELMDATLAGLISEQNQHPTFARSLTKLKNCFAMAHAMIIESAQDIFSEEDATLAIIRELEELDRQEAAGAGEEAARTLQQEEDARREQEATGEAVARLLEEENRHAATGNDALLAQEAADRFAREQEEEDLARALSLQEENRPAVDNDILIAQAIAAEEREAAEAATQALLQRERAGQQPALGNNRAAQEAAGLEAARRFQAEEAARTAAEQEAATQALLLAMQAEEEDQPVEDDAAIARRMQNEWNG